MIYLGTSGFSYDDWVGPFYPPGTKRDRMFATYCNWFNAVEINASFYHIPGAATMHRLVQVAAGRIHFSMKMSRLVTHEADLGERTVASFRNAADVVAHTGMLGAVLLQFPFRFHCTPENREYLLRALKTFSAYPLVVEIRHDSWQTDEGWQFFRDHGINLCIVDMPDLSRLPRTALDLTGSIPYVRFHGRNRKNWFSDNEDEIPFDYFYEEEALRAWVEPVQDLERKAAVAFVFFNNHPRAQGAENALTLQALLEGRCLPPSDPDLFSGMKID